MIVMVPPDHFLYLRIYHIITIAYLPLTVSSRFYGAFCVIPKIPWIAQVRSPWHSVVLPVFALLF